MNYDLIVIGSGPGGYVAAIRAAQLGMKTAIIEKYPTLGGTCLNVGCIPSKALLDSSEHYYNALQHFAEHGIEATVTLNLAQMIARKAEVVKQNVSGIDFLMKKNKIDVLHGVASFKDEHSILVQGEKENVTITGQHIIIATGSKPAVPPAFNYDKKRVITSTEALQIEKLPKRMIIIGGGVIGLELGSVFARLGTEVEVVEYLDRIIATMDQDLGKELQRVLKKIGIKFHLGHMVTGVKSSSKGVTVDVRKRDTEDSFSLQADYCLVAIGRRPYTDGLGLENAGLATDDKGRIPVNEQLQTAKSHIYAIGDVVRGAMLAHKAEEEGVFAVETIAGQKPVIHYHLIPGVVYTWPEVAGVGYTEQECKDKGLDFKTGKFPYKALGRARASMDTEGFVKIIADAHTDEVLGVHIIGARAADLIQEATAVMEYRGSAEDIARMSHPHPTYSEAMKEAALNVDGRSIHI
ncbi:MAG: dihydrolipoyl dehydrogenase [Saprospiraceae bacterium]|nr:dihydrolipoyl dehydrogenase [Saprospiraceae bacterium]MCB9321827.1 dihydrolipoyl dehydrogenase [Lewinellaceae bacterium]